MRVVLLVQPVEPSHGEHLCDAGDEAVRVSFHFIKIQE
jgi:hypothetical protein